MDVNRSAQILKKELEKEGIEIKHTKALDIVSKSQGYKSYKNYKDHNWWNYDAQILIKADVASDGWDRGVKVNAASEEDATEKMINALKQCHVTLHFPGDYPDYDRTGVDCTDETKIIRLGDNDVSISILGVSDIWRDFSHADTKK